MRCARFGMTLNCTSEGSKEIDSMFVSPVEGDPSLRRSQGPLTSTDYDRLRGIRRIETCVVYINSRVSGLQRCSP